MGKFIDITGNKYGRLTVLSYVGNNKWKCQCECGNTKNIIGGNLRKGTTKTCGCLRKNPLFQRQWHGMTGTKIYTVWLNMMHRCYYPKDISYHNYGGRGISVCERWHNFANFLNDIIEIPTGLSIDRINNNGNYEPENIKFSTRKEQANNMQRSKKYKIAV